MLFLKIAVAVVLLLMLWGLVAYLRDRNRRQGEERKSKRFLAEFSANLEDLLVRAEVPGALEQDVDLRTEVENFSTKGYTLGTDHDSRYNQVLAEARRLRRFDASVSRVQKAKNTYGEKVPGSLDAIMALDALQRAFDYYSTDPEWHSSIESVTGIKLADIRGQLAEMASDYVGSRSERAEHDRDAYNDLVEFYDDWYHYSEFFKSIEGVRRSSEWATWTIRYFNNPALVDFRITKRDLPNGELRLQAAQALLSQDLASILIVLAYANLRREGAYYREELGDVLLSDLAHAAVQLRANALNPSS